MTSVTSAATPSRTESLHHTHLGSGPGSGVGSFGALRHSLHVDLEEAKMSVPSAVSLSGPEASRAPCR